MDLSDKMPARQDSTLAAKMPAKMNSDRPGFKDEGKSDDAPVVPISRDSAPADTEWECINEQHGDMWQTSDQKTGPSDGYSLDDRKENESGGMPQRDPDNDGDLN